MLLNPERYREREQVGMYLSNTNRNQYATSVIICQYKNYIFIKRAKEFIMTINYNKNILPSCLLKPAYDISRVITYKGIKIQSFCFNIFLYKT